MHASILPIAIFLQFFRVYSNVLKCNILWQVPEELHSRNGTLLNKDNIYITKTTPSFVVKCFQEQFHKDFSLFLKLRHEELVYGGKMVLTFVGRKDEDVYDGDTNQFYGLLARSLQSLVAKISKRGTYKVSFTFFCVV